MPRLELNQSYNGVWIDYNNLNNNDNDEDENQELDFNKIRDWFKP